MCPASSESASSLYVYVVPYFDAMLFEIIYMIGMAGVIACNGMILVAQYQLRKNAKTSVNAYVASLSISAIIFACFFAPTVLTAYFQTLSPPPRDLVSEDPPRISFRPGFILLDTETDILGI